MKTLHDIIFFFFFLFSLNSVIAAVSFQRQSVCALWQTVAWYQWRCWRRPWRPSTATSPQSYRMMMILPQYTSFPVRAVGCGWFSVRTLSSSSVSVFHRENPTWTGANVSQGHNSIFFFCLSFFLSTFLSFFLSLFLTSYLALTLNVSSFIVIDKPKEGDEYLSLMISSQSKVIRPLCFVPLPSREAAHSQSWVSKSWLSFFFSFENDVRLFVWKTSSVTASASLRQRPPSVLFVCLQLFLETLSVWVLHGMTSGPLDALIKPAGR